MLNLFFSQILSFLLGSVSFLPLRNVFDPSTCHPWLLAPSFLQSHPSPPPASAPIGDLSTKRKLTFYVVSAYIGVPFLFLFCDREVGRPPHTPEEACFFSPSTSCKSPPAWIIDMIAFLFFQRAPSFFRGSCGRFSAAADSLTHTYRESDLCVKNGSWELRSIPSSNPLFMPKLIGPCCCIVRAQTPLENDFVFPHAC